MVPDRHVQLLPRLLSWRVVMAGCALSAVACGIFLLATPRQGVGNGWPWGEFTLLLLFWLNGLLLIVLSAMLFMRGTTTFGNHRGCSLALRPIANAKFPECMISGTGRFHCEFLQRMGVGFFSLQCDWRLNTANDEFAAMCGFAAQDEVLEKTFFAVIEEADVSKARECTLQLAAGKTASNIFSRQCHDGKLRHHMVMLSPLRRDGELLGAEGIMVDVTDHRAVEDRIRRHLEELAQVQRVNSMGKMVSELAHEISQPLYAITNYAEACSQVVRSGQPLQNDMLLGWMNQVAEQADRAAEVVRRLRGFIHKSKAQRVEVDLNRRIENVIHLMRSVARENCVDVEFHAAEPLPCVLADPIQIDQVLVNLMQNSIEAMENIPKQQRRIMIETSCEDGHMIRAAVRDMGPGLEEKNVNRIFDAFYSTKENGLGMGLAICRSIMLDHGGRLWPTHNLHHGTTFHFSLPASMGG